MLRLVRRASMTTFAPLRYSIASDPNCEERIKVFWPAMEEFLSATVARSTVDAPLASIKDIDAAAILKIQAYTAHCAADGQKWEPPSRSEPRMPGIVVGAIGACVGIWLMDMTTSPSLEGNDGSY